MEMPRVYILIPTYREIDQLKKCLFSLEHQTFKNFTAAVVNSNPGDETSEYLHSYQGSINIVEIQASPSDYWTGAIAKGLAWCQMHADSDDYVLFLNADVQLSSNVIAGYLDYAVQYPRAMFCAVTVSGGRYLSSGVQMKSWWLSLTEHPLLGEIFPLPNLPELISVDMLAGRAMFFPIRLLYEIGGVREKWLPHYGADYEFSCRAKRKASYDLYIASQLVACVDKENTGIKMYKSNTHVYDRALALFSIKSTANLKYKSRFVYSCYPKPAVLSAIFVNIAKSIAEVLFGKSVYRFFRRAHF